MLTVGDVVNHKQEAQLADNLKSLDPSALWDVAYKVGMAAGEAILPVPMTVVNSHNPNERYHVSEGMCGFAWVNVKPGTSKFARWLKTNADGYKDYHGGISVWISEFGQGIARKEACAKAIARVLRLAGITAYGQSRLD